MKVEWTAEADRDIDGIWLYIADDNLDAADRVVERIRTLSLNLEDHPALGRRGLPAGTREWS